jgi:hypothetical protein
MRLLRFALPLAVIVALAVGFLPLVGTRGALDQYGTEAGLAALHDPNHANAAAAAVIRHHPGVHLLSMRRETSLNGLPAVTVVVEERVHSYLDRLPKLQTWFQVTTTVTTVGT